MSRNFPPFAAVRAFEAAARKGSMKDAADELCLTASAVSHQIRALETYLDTALFTRSGNRVELTLTGRAYARKLTTLLDLFDETTRTVKEAGNPSGSIARPVSPPAGWCRDWGTLPSATGCGFPSRTERHRPISRPMVPTWSSSGRTHTFRKWLPSP